MWTTWVSKWSRPRIFIVIIIPFQMGWGDLGVHGEPNRDTPNIDKMALQGRLFTNFYTAAPLCSPCRFLNCKVWGRRLKIFFPQLGLPSWRGDFLSEMDSIRTTREEETVSYLKLNIILVSSHFFRTAYTPQEIVGGITNEVLISEVLRQSGSKYDTMLIGKWHLGHRPAYLPLEHGFKRWFGAPDCHFHYGNGTGSPNIPVYRNKRMVGRRVNPKTISYNPLSSLNIWIGFTKSLQ